MLVLSRKLGEVICIGEDITIEVVEFRGGKVKLGVVADGLEVDRLEIREAKDAERRRKGGAH